MIKIGLILFLAALSFLPNLAWSNSLGNSGKRFTDGSQITKSDWSDPAELQRTWEAAIARVPTGTNRSRKVITSKLETLDLGSKKLPAVVFSHGCGGFWKGTEDRIRFLANAGFVVVAPASFARKKYPQSCDPKTHRGGLYRGQAVMRTYDAAYAVGKVKSLPYVDPDKVVLMGTSEGGIVAAVYNPRDVSNGVAARIIEAWTCHSDWPEYRGLRAGSNEPVLSLVGDLDPWTQNSWSRGHCGAFMRDNGSRSVVYREGRLAKEHGLMDFKDPRRRVLEFLAETLN